MYVVTYKTESGDEGILGVFNSKPSFIEVDELLAMFHPEDFESQTIVPELHGPFEVR